MARHIDIIADTIITFVDDKSPAQVSTIVRDVVTLLHEEGMLGQWRELLRAIDKAWARRYGAANVTVMTAHPMSNELRALLEERAKGADIRETVDDRLIGGAVVRIDNTRIDGSITGTLMRLKQALYSEV